MTHNINPSTPPFTAAISGDATELSINTDELAHTDLSWLQGLTNLRRLHIKGSKVSDRMLAVISWLDLEELFLENGSRVTVRSNRSLKKLVAKFVDFEQGGEWPNLKVAHIKSTKHIADLVDGSPQLEELHHDSEPTNWMGGFAQENRVTQTITSASLKRAVLDSNFAIKDCPQLVDLEIGGSIEIVGTPKLKTLRLRVARLDENSGLARLHSVEELYIGSVGGLAIAFPPNARVIPWNSTEWNEDRDGWVTIQVFNHMVSLPLNGLTHLRLAHFGELPANLEILEQAHDLEEIELSGSVNDISALANLQNLRHVDVSRCDGLTDISPLIDAPNLESVTIGLRDIAHVPDELNSRVKEAV